MGEYHKFIGPYPVTGGSAVLCPACFGSRDSVGVATINRGDKLGNHGIGMAWHQVHLVSVAVNQNGIIDTITGAGFGKIGPHVRSGEEIDHNDRRGTVVEISYECECGHLFQHQFTFYKGVTEAEIVSVGTASGDSNGDLWRD